MPSHPWWSKIHCAHSAIEFQKQKEGLETMLYGCISKNVCLSSQNFGDRDIGIPRDHWTASLDESVISSIS